ncbi:hypothetical protein BDV97DRAFT_417264 [Delphinella strobiligena]|nr:hypothetical protein BDV97DRAFT_417264 [Delphinella strobiligena]
MSELLRTPSLTALDGHFRFRKMHPRDVLGLEPSNVSSLTLLENMVEASDQFYTVMTSFKALRKFDLLISEHPWGFQSIRTNIAGFFLNLSPQIKTLETISIRTTFDPWREDYTVDGPVQAVTSLHFNALRKFSILQDSLLPQSLVPGLQGATLTDMSTDTLFAALPFSIEEVELTHCFILVMWKHLHHLLDHVASFSFNIRKITTVSEKDYEKRYAQLFSKKGHRAEMVDQDNEKAEAEGHEGNYTTMDSPEDQESIADNTDNTLTSWEEVTEKSWCNEFGDLLDTEYEERDRHYFAFLTREYKQLAQRFEDAGIEWIWE